VLPVESTRAWEAESVAAPAFVRLDTVRLICKVALLEGELVESRRAREVSKEKFHSLSGSPVDGAWWLMVSQMERHEQFEELQLHVFKAWY
jgi:hypothetical protein